MGLNAQIRRNTRDLNKAINLQGRYTLMAKYNPTQTFSVPGVRQLITAKDAADIIGVHIGDLKSKIGKGKDRRNANR